MVATAALTGVADAKSCKDVSGPFSSVLILGPPCTSPIGMCTHGVLSGNLDGTYDFTFLTLTPDASDPTLLHYTGASEITVDEGGQHLFGHDTGVLHLTDAGDYFVTTVSVVYGDRGYQHAAGQIVASGKLDFVTGQAVGSYTGNICRN